ncbi:trans-alpha-bergamotene synthase-like isoform X1 [Olea europaea var. sylvestris]|uniref:trans-alpha-bergamotene synthase-like isoform X1 n=1 Tax=Olea europaea var. sylvestris TaxID=158386 RepID=UPI000C1CCC26|nr:trans-alpha-bergamotene synthase-like isoform X1 [Olea europaea var. sylvestris]
MEARRSGNYQTSIWDDNYVQSISSPYVGKEYLELAENLKEKTRIIINETEGELDQLELIDNLQRLDVSYHFQDEIKKLLEHTYLNSTGHNNENEKDLYSMALKFRLLRQHGYRVPQEVFCSFMDEGGSFRPELSDDIEGILSLYEASFLSMESEGILGDARNFATQHLKEKLQHITDHGLAVQVSHALELPLHWRVQKLEAKWFINVYESRRDANLILLELAKLDFNILQAIYQDEIKQMSRWYKETCLPEKLSFVRHRLVECFWWALGFTPEPQFGYSRRNLTKIAVLITIMDDIYDTYGSLDELELFTDIVERWDINALNQLPEYMRICFLALFNSTNEIAYDVLKDQGLNIISNIRKSWAELCRVYLIEARWYNSGYFPSLSEYLNAAWISISGPVLLLHAYFCTINPLTKKDLGSLEQYPGIIHWPSLVLRLANDLGTSSDEIKRGDVPKSIQCYMKDTGCSEEDAREYIKYLIDVTWKKINKEILMNSPCKDFAGTAMNLARTSQCMYQYGDGFGVPHLETKRNIISLIIEPISLQFRSGL